MKKIVLINSVYNQGSTGRICFELSQFFNKNGFYTKTFYGRNKNDSPDGVFFGSKLDTYLHGIKSRITDKQGFYSKSKTKKLIRQLDDFKPDLIILHNLHGYYLNIKMLLSWINNNGVKVISVFHDCWNFTGHCAHFSLKKCTKWVTGCHECPAKKEYPKSILFDNSKKNYQIKKELFSAVKDLTIVCPSNWLADLVKVSFFSSREIKVINNGIDTNIFKKNVGAFKTTNHLENKKLILCIANMFDEKKGLYDVVSLSEMIAENTFIVMVGQIKGKVDLPKNIIHIDRTDNIDQLVDIYSSCDVMFNPTYEDNYPTTNLEAVSCELPVVCYKTGGAIESVDSNFLVNQGDVKKAKEIIDKLFMNKIHYDFSKKAFFSKEIMFEKYLELVSEVLNKNKDK